LPVHFLDRVGPLSDDAAVVTTPHFSGRVAVARDRLLDRMAVRWTTPVVVVTAPAGYGKTTLLRQVVSAPPSPGAGIDAYVQCAPSSIAMPSFGEALCDAVQASVGACDGVGIDDVAAEVAGAIRRRAPRHVAVLVDDVHEIPADSESARLLDAIVTTLPSNGHAVLAGRRPPPIPLSRTEVEGGVVRVDQRELAFTPAEIRDFALQRDVPVSAVASCGGWPALAELLASARSDVVHDYVREEVARDFGPEKRRQLALLSHLGWFDEEVARAVVGDDVDVAGLLDDVPLVEPGSGDHWFLHPLWQLFLGGETTPHEVDDARRTAGRALLRRGEPAAALPLLIRAVAWDDAASAVVAALSAAHPPVGRDVLADWYARLPSEVTDAPAGQLLDAVISNETDPAGARTRLEGAATAFRERDDPAGELTCLVHLGLSAWWSDDPTWLGALAARVVEMEAAGHEAAMPFACLGRALVYDMADDSAHMLRELDRIPAGALNEPWQAIVTWLRATALLQLGHCAEAQASAEEAIAHGRSALAPLIESTRLQAMWFQGRAADVFDELPSVVATLAGSGQHNLAIAAGQAAVVNALDGRTAEAVRYLDGARAAIAGGSAAVPLVDSVVAIARVAIAVSMGDEPAARRHLARYIARYPIGAGIPVPLQRRHLCLFYVLAPETRAVWDGMELGPAWHRGRELARALVALREEQNPSRCLPALDDPAVVRAHLPTPWVVELALGAVAAGRSDGWRLLESTWSTAHETVDHLAHHARPAQRKAASAALRRLPAVPTGVMRLDVLGALELRRDGVLVDAPDWRRERVRSLLTYLVVHPTVGRTQVGDDLWPALDHDAQSRNLRVTLTYLLRILEPDRSHRAPSYLVRQHGNNLVLHTDGCLSIDLWEFDELWGRAMAADRRGAPSEVLTHATRALDLWRGEPAEALCEPWAVARVEQCRIRLTDLATRAADLLLAQSHIAEARDVAERAVQANPWSDDGHRLLIATHRAADDRLAARRAANRYLSSLNELGIDSDKANVLVQRMLEDVG
jgi:LuxR family transcriptional regulator, maltose regulon positive regulatory protein